MTNCRENMGPMWTRSLDSSDRSMFGRFIYHLLSFSQIPSFYYQISMSFSFNQIMKTLLFVPLDDDRSTSFESFRNMKRLAFGACHFRNAGVFCPRKSSPQAVSIFPLADPDQKKRRPKIEKYGLDAHDCEIY